MVSHEFRGVPAPHASLGHWLPKDRAHIKQWLATKLSQLDQRGSVTLDPTVTAMQDLSDIRRIRHDPTGKPQVRDFDTMIGLVDMILKEGPQWFDITDPPTAMGLIGFPINAILDWPMGTVAGFQFFLDVQVNEKWQAILNMGGWLSNDALNILSARGNDGKTDFTFQKLYKCDPSLAYFRFQSWDEFFTREFNEGVRPIAYPDDQPSTEQADPKKVIINACESTPLGFATNVKLHDIFWLKQQPYSLADMLNNQPLTEQFVRTYYSQNLLEGFADPDGPDPSAPNNSQRYISAVAARGIIFIKADNQGIGLMAIVFVGMAEVSSWDFTVEQGDVVKKGDPIGTFHLGGYSQCIVFRPETGLAAGNFANPPPYEPNAPNNTAFRSVLAILP